MSKVLQLTLEIGLLAFLAMLYYLYQKRKIGYYVQREFELLCTDLLNNINAQVSELESSSEDSEKLSGYCIDLENLSISINSLKHIKELFKDNDNIKNVAEQIIQILKDQPLQ